MKFTVTIDDDEIKKAAEKYKRYRNLSPDFEVDPAMVVEDQLEEFDSVDVRQC